MLRVVVKLCLNFLGEENDFFCSNGFFVMKFLWGGNCGDFKTLSSRAVLKFFDAKWKKKCLKIKDSTRNFIDYVLVSSKFQNQAFCPIYRVLPHLSFTSSFTINIFILTTQKKRSTCRILNDLTLNTSRRKRMNVNFLARSQWH
jgi:hypothetical protein